MRSLIPILILIAACGQAEPTPTPPPARRLVERPAGGGLPAQNAFFDPGFDLIHFVWWAEIETDVGYLRRRVDADAPTGQPILRFDPYKLTPVPVEILGLAQSIQGPARIELWVGRSPELPPAAASLVGLSVQGETRAIPLLPEGEAVTAQGVRWQRVTARYDDPFVGWSVLRVAVKDGRAFSVSRPVLLAAESGAGLLPRGSRPATAEEARAIQGYRRHLLEEAPRALSSTRRPSTPVARAARR